MKYFGYGKSLQTSDIIKRDKCVDSIIKRIEEIDGKKYDERARRWSEEWLRLALAGYSPGIVLGNFTTPNGKIVSKYGIEKIFDFINVKASGSQLIVTT